MYDEPFSTDELALLEQLPPDGTSCGNISLFRHLGWSQTRYFAARDRLEDRGLISRGRGKGEGGSIRRVEGAAEDEDPLHGFDTSEKELYEGLRDTLASGWWTQEQRLGHEYRVEITAFQGKRATGGRWTRPDLTLVAIRDYDLLPGRYLDVITFEVKHYRTVDTTAVYETLAHRRAATASYVLLYAPPAVDYDDSLLALQKEADRFAVGILVADDPYDPYYWEEITSPLRQEPEPEALDTFLSTQLSFQAQEWLSNEFATPRY